MDSDALRLWSDVGERRRAIQAIVDALQSDDVAARDTVKRVDRAIVAALEAMGLPRGPIRTLVLEGGIGPYGRKDPDCTLVLLGDRMRELLPDARGPDTVFRTWVDESIHARQPYVAGYRQEYARWRGYEEGLAEGLARIVVRDWAGLDPIESAYGYYIAGYASLARVAEVDLEYLWRRVWQVPTGRVRNTFTDALDELRSQRATAALTARQGATLRGVADTMFGSDRRDAIPNQDAVMRLWEAALR